MNDDLKLALQSAALGVFKDLTFMLPSRGLNESQQNAPFQMAAAVEFWGPISGKLEVAIYGNLVQIMAANMLGETGFPTEFQQRDALKELTNVLCGNMLPQLLGEEAVYKIDAPCVLEIMDRPSTSGAQPSAQLQVGMDMGRADVQLFLYRNPPVEPPV